MSQEALLPVDAASLPDDPEFLKRLVTQLVETVRDRDGRIQRLEHNMDLLLRRLYGRSSEKLDPRQGVLFENLSVEESPPVAPLAEPAPSDRPVDSSPRRGHGRRRTEKNLRHVDIVHDLTEAEKEALGGEVRLVLIGEEITEQYEWEPSCLYVIRHIQRKYVRRPQPVGTHAIQPSEHLEGENTAEHKHATAQPIVVEEPSTQDLEEPAVIVAPKPPQPIPGGLAGPGLLAQLLVSKYADHLPLHRFERISQRHGVRFSRQTTCDWSLACADLLGPLDELSRDEVLASAVVHTDDTPVDVRNAHRKEQYTARFWDYVGDDGHRLVWFDYTPSRKRDGPARILKDFEGYLQADAFSGYDGIFVQSRGKIREVACWAHSRRKFKDAQNTDVARGQIALARIGQLYAIERESASGAKPNGRICWRRNAMPGSLPSGNPAPRPCSRPSRPGSRRKPANFFPRNRCGRRSTTRSRIGRRCAGTPRPGSSTSTITRPNAPCGALPWDAAIGCFAAAIGAAVPRRSTSA